jgi:hypothetical protein
MNALRFGLVAAVVSAVPTPRRRYRSGSQLLCHNGNAHELKYNVLHAPGLEGSLDNLDQVKGLEELQCDIDGTRLKIEFVGIVHATYYNTKWEIGKSYLVGGGSKGCPLLPSQLEAGFLLRYVTGSYQNGTTVYVDTAPAQYDQIYEHADISFGSTGVSCESAGLGVSQHVCVGINSDDCESSKATIPVYQNADLNLQCTNCFAALEADIFFTLTIKEFAVQSLVAGFQNVKINAGAEVSFDAQKSWSVGTDKDLELVPKTPVIQFSIVEVPFALYFEAPMSMHVEATLPTTATAVAGLTATYSMDELSLDWAPSSGWQQNTTIPELSHQIQASGDASFSGQATISLVPTFKLMANQMFHMSTTVTPVFNLKVNGDAAKEQICETANYSAKIDAEAEFKLNIPWLHINDDKKWSGEVFSKQGTLNQKCFSARV